VIAIRTDASKLRIYIYIKALLHKHNNTTLHKLENTVQIKNQIQITKASSNRGNNKQNKRPTNTANSNDYFETNFEIKNNIDIRKYK